MVIFLYHKEKTLLTQKAMTLSMRHLSLLERTTPTPPLSLGGKKTYPTKKTGDISSKSEPPRLFR